MKKARWVVAVVGACAYGAIASPRVRADAPAGRFTDLGDEVRDEVTHLVWKKNPEAQGAVPWSTASGLCSPPWRLPTVKELSSIVDRSRATPALDPVFGTDPTYRWFWSATPSVDGPGRFCVNFDGGTVMRMSMLAEDGIKNFVRCVR